MKNLLIVEDNYKLALSIKEFLGSRNYDITIEIDGLLGYQKATNSNYDLVILDINLPRKNGIDILRSLRELMLDIPILMLTATYDTDDVVLGLDKGADGYIGKPFNMLELKARIDRMLSRPPRYAPNILTVNDLSLDTNNRMIIRKDTKTILKKTEFAILQLLLNHKGQVLTRQQIINNVWASNEERSPGIIDVYIKHLRDKIDRGFDKKLITTVHGLGYMIKLK